MSRVFFDTNLFIYFIEDSDGRGKQVADLIDRMSERKDEVVTSALTLGELLVKPLAESDNELAGAYERTLNSPGISVVSFDRHCARIFAALRQDRSIKPADAIQLSCAGAARCDLFVTNDDRLSRKITPGIQFITSLDRVPI